MIAARICFAAAVLAAMIAPFFYREWLAMLLWRDTSLIKESKNA